MSLLNDFLFGSNDAQKSAEKAANNAQLTPYDYVGPGGSLSGFGTLSPAVTAGTQYNGQPLNQFGMVDIGKSDGKGIPVMMDPKTGQAYANVGGKPVPAKGGIVLNDGTKLNSTPGTPIQNWQAYAPKTAGPAVNPGAQPVPTGNGGIQMQIPQAPTAGTAQTQAVNPAQPAAAGGVPSVSPTTSAMSGFPSAPNGVTPSVPAPNATVFGGIGDLDPIRAALVQAFPQLTQAGVNGVAGLNTQVTPQSMPDFMSTYNQNLALLRQQAQPQEDAQYNSLQSRLFGQGRLGTTGGNANIEAFAKGLGESDVARQLAAFNTAQGVQNQGMAQNQYTTNTQLANVQNAINQGQLTFAQAQQLFGNILSTNQVGNANFTNALNAAIAKSNAAAGQASVLAGMPQDNGALATMLGGFMSGFGGGVGTKV